MQMHSDDIFLLDNSCGTTYTFSKITLPFITLQQISVIALDMFQTSKTGQIITVTSQIH